MKRVLTLTLLACAPALAQMEVILPTYSATTTGPGTSPASRLC